MWPANGWGDHRPLITFHYLTYCYSLFIILHTAIHFSLSYILLFTFHYLTYYSSLPIILHILHTTIAFHYLTYPQICIHIGALKKCLQLKIPSIKNADKIKVGVVDRSRHYCSGFQIYIKNTKKEERKMQIKVSVVGRRGTDGLARIAPRQCLPPCTSHTPNYKQLQQHQYRLVDIGHRI